VEPVRDFLLQAEAILHNNPVFDPGSSTRKFRLLMSDYVEAVLMAEALPRIGQFAPGIRFEFISNVEGASMLSDRGEIDLSIAPTFGFLPNILPSRCSRTNSRAWCGPATRVLNLLSRSMNI